MKIPLVDLKKEYQSIKPEIDNAIQKVIDNTSFINGEEVEIFEKKFAEFCQNKYCVGVDSGSAALFVALKCLNIKEGDEVITTPSTFIATTEAIKLAGARPVFVDVKKENNLIDENLIEEAITDKTKAIIPVHLYGNVCEMDKIKEIADKYNLEIIEDCAQAHGAEFNGKKVPVYGVGCFSFFPAKILGAYGDAGGIITDNEELYKEMKLYKDHGRETKYKHIKEGFNFRLDNLQAAILNIKLRYLNGWIEKRRELAKKYNKDLENIKDIELFKTSNEVKNSYYMYVIKLASERRDKFMQFLKENKIASGIHFPISLNKQPVYEKEYSDKSFKHSEKIAEQIVSIPLYPFLEKEEQGYIIDKIKEFFRK